MQTRPVDGTDLFALMDAVSDWEHDTYGRLLRSRSAGARVAGVHAVRGDGVFGHTPGLRALLNDDAPFVFQSGARRFVGEVRFEALVALEEMMRTLQLPPDFGPVTLRPAMPVEEAIARAQRVSAALSAEDRADLRTRVACSLADRVRPRPADRQPVAAYRLLQLAGEIAYRSEDVDSRTWLTPLQEHLISRQLRRPRPRPHLRVTSRARPGWLLGFVWRDDAKSQWMLDFSEGHEAAEASVQLRWLLVGLHPDGPPRVLRDETGEPMRNGDGSTALHGLHPLETADPVALLRDLGELADRWYVTALVR